MHTTPQHPRPFFFGRDKEDCGFLRNHLPWDTRGLHLNRGESKVKQAKAKPNHPSIHPSINQPTDRLQRAATQRNAAQRSQRQWQRRGPAAAPEKKRSTTGTSPGKKEKTTPGPGDAVRHEPALLLRIASVRRGGYGLVLVAGLCGLCIAQHYTALYCMLRGCTSPIWLRESCLLPSCHGSLTSHFLAWPFVGKYEGVPQAAYCPSTIAYLPTLPTYNTIHTTGQYNSTQFKFFNAIFPTHPNQHSPMPPKQTPPK